MVNACQRIFTWWLQGRFFAASYCLERNKDLSNIQNYEELPGLQHVFSSPSLKSTRCQRYSRTTSCQHFPLPDYPALSSMPWLWQWQKHSCMHAWNPEWLSALWSCYSRLCLQKEQASHLQNSHVASKMNRVQFIWGAGGGDDVIPADKYRKEIPNCWDLKPQKPGACLPKLSQLLWKQH